MNPTIRPKAIVLVAALVLWLAPASLALAQRVGTTTRVSVSSTGTQGNAPSDRPAISANGRYVAFMSDATNLECVINFEPTAILVHDQQTGQTECVSLSINGSQINGISANPTISADGRFVAFESLASNLVAGDTNGYSDIFVHDRATDQTTRVSVASDGTQGNSSSANGSISGNGRWVAFESFSDNLVAGDSNVATDVFVHDRLTGQTRRVSVASNGAQANGLSNDPAVSANGRVVAFESSANNLAPGDSPFNDVFVHDLRTGQTTVVSVASDGSPANDIANDAAISGDGRIVAFLSYASNLVPGDTNDWDDVFVHDRATGQTTRVSVASNGAQTNRFSVGPAISTNGRVVTFYSLASTLVPGDTNLKTDVFAHDRTTGQTARVSVASDGTQGDDNSLFSAVSGDGRYITFASEATNLVPSDTNLQLDIFVHDLGQ